MNPLEFASWLQSAGETGFKNIEDRTMKNDSHPGSRHISNQPVSGNTWSHALIWLLLALAALLLVGFTAVVNDITERGELRRVQQRSSGSLVLPDDLQSTGDSVVRLLSVTGEKLVAR
jgi:lysophospholipase L1-like esterase